MNFSGMKLDNCLNSFLTVLVLEVDEKLKGSVNPNDPELLITTEASWMLVTRFFILQFSGHTLLTHPHKHDLSHLLGKGNLRDGNSEAKYW